MTHQQRGIRHSEVSLHRQSHPGQLLSDRLYPAGLLGKAEPRAQLLLPGGAAEVAEPGSESSEKFQLLSVIGSSTREPFQQ